jgi:hypothetical protein
LTEELERDIDALEKRLQKLEAHLAQQLQTVREQLGELSLMRSLLAS